MRGRFINSAVWAILLLCQFSICFGSENVDSNDSTKYLDVVREFADKVLKYGRDTYGPKYTPLFVDGLNVHTYEPVKWIAPNSDRWMLSNPNTSLLLRDNIAPDNDKWILSNLASQQNLFRTLDGLTRITGDPKYKQAAMDAIKVLLKYLWVKRRSFPVLCFA